MAAEKVIVIGCDDPAGIANILNALNDIALLSHNTISASRASDLMGIVNTVNPDVILLAFRNNQNVLNNFHTFVKQPEIPIVCFTRDMENHSLHWPANHIVFTMPFEYVVNKEYLSRRINSIFNLNARAVKATPAISLAEAAMRQTDTADHRNLSRYAMELDQKVELLQKVKDRIVELYPAVDDVTRKELTFIANSIKIAANDGKLWEDFKLYFEQTNPHFLRILAKKYPSLTPIDLKYCCYLKMNMSNDDIRNLLGINQESVRTHKYRLKQKMLLDKDQDLTTYLRAVDQQGTYQR